MDITGYIVKIDGKDRTNAIEQLVLLKGGNSYQITYKNRSKPYTYNKSRVVLHERPKCYSGNVLEYLKNIAVLPPKSSPATPKSEQDSEDSFLKKQLDKVECIEGKSVLYDYMSKKDSIRRAYDTSGIIYPFGCNKSQLQAIRNALTSNITIIEGPPGTGKTQTILNIIANALKENKNVAVVSGNNSATANVAEKLIEKGYGDIVAILGNKSNRTFYFSIPHQPIPKFKDVDNDKASKYQEELTKNTPRLEELLKLDNDLTELERVIFQVQFEADTFNKSRKLANAEKVLRLFGNKRWNSNKWASLRDYCEAWKNQDKYAKNSYFDARFSDVRIWLNTLFKHNFRINAPNLPSILDIADYASLKFYETKKVELQKTKEGIVHRLKGLKPLLDRQQELSRYIFHNSLNKNISREVLDIDDENYWIKDNFKAFVKQVPIILSTTNSIKQSVSRNFVFDYLIIDEASQVDLITATIALSCTKNLIIVGDEKQLPHIVSNPSPIVKLSIGIDAMFNYVNHSILTSIKQLSQIPCVTLREHYRCDPLIIDFCNQRFYGGQLIIKKEWSNNNPFEIYTTDRKKSICVMRDGQQKLINPDQHSKSIEVVKSILNNEDITDNDICVIAPYRAYVNKLQVDMPNIAIDTVHKFQGREKNSVIISTVQDRNIEDEFLNNSNLVNVAVSRAIKELKIICGYSMYQGASQRFNMGALINYMRYYSGNVVFHSIFDHLYDHNLSKSRQVYLSSLYGSIFASENLIHELLHNEVLNERDDIGILFNYPLRYVVRDNCDFTTEERLFISRSSHIDFLLYYKLDKSPILAIEVNGQQHNKPIQKRRDEIKKSILDKCKIELLVLKTTGSNEKERITERLEELT